MGLISSTFYTKAKRAAFLSLRLALQFFWRQNFGEKFARKMLMKLTHERFYQLTKMNEMEYRKWKFKI